MVSGTWYFHEILTEVVQNCEGIFAFGDGHCDKVYVYDIKWFSATPTITYGPIWTLVIVSLVFCAGGARIDVSLYVTVLELPPVTGKVFAHTGDIRIIKFVL